MAIQVQQIDHVALTVRNIERSIHWYCEVLGMEHRYPELWDGVPALLFSGETSIALFPVKSDSPLPPPGNDCIAMIHLAFRVDRDTFQMAQQYLRERGIAWTFENHAICHSLYFADPDGHRLELTTYELEP
jgi:catechol 2,3-dioxygenase-like lactoylglutathione lyase family enzyme